jgi:hypothetical protein
VILLDTGPIVAAINRADPDHAACAAAMRTHAGSLLTTWPVMTEAMHFLAKLGGWPAQLAAWKLLARQVVKVVELEARHGEAMQEWMEKYQDLPMDLADASLVALAESLDLRRVCTLDAHFTVYRLASKKAFTLLP